MGLPSWGGWDWEQKYLPKEIHTKRGFKSAIKNITKVCAGASVLKGGIVLCYGLLLREVERAHFLLLDPDQQPPTDTPSWVTKSALEISFKTDIFNSIKDTMLVL